MTQKQLEDYLWGAANILRGMIDAADFKQYIFPLLLPTAAPPPIVAIKY
jgi:type I restriction enzyme M protein